jgi:hydrogenase small subunit
MAFAAIGKDAVREFDVLWITAGWGCDGDTIAMTAAPRPAAKMSSLGQVPWIPKTNLHNPFLALAIGDDFLRPFHDAAEGVRIPQEKYAAQPRRV